MPLSIAGLIYTVHQPSSLISAYRFIWAIVIMMAVDFYS